MRQSADGKRATTVDQALSIVRTPRALREAVGGWRGAGETVALVPTMGALHAGHLALVSEAKARARRVVVSIFINPSQFAPTEDLARYPQTFDADCAMLSDARADLVYAPTALEMYPSGFSSTVHVGGPALVGLEDSARPHFFGGVATVVTKLLNQTAPDVALFGEKDYQQLRVIDALVRDLDMPLSIVPVLTVREADGLALSSRNRFLTADERRRSAAVPATLHRVAEAIRKGGPSDAALQAGRAALTESGLSVEYLEVRQADTLSAAEDGEHRPLRVLVAARIGSVRLIDNVAV